MSTQGMSEGDYIQTQVSINLIEQINAELDLPGFLARISRAQTLGPILDPTMYRAASDKLRHIETVARKLRELQVITQEARAREAARKGG